MSAAGGGADAPVEVREWAAARARVAELVRAASDSELHQPVPACPDWTCLDLVRHVVGLGADVLGGDEPDDHDPSWTQAHVDRRQESPADEVLQEWDDLADDLVRWMLEHGTRPLGDLVIHEQDLRSALGRAGARDTEGFALVRERMAGRFGTAVEGRPPIALVGADWQWCSEGPVDDAETVLSAGDYDLGRALTSRRTAEQLRSWVTRGDVEPYLDAFAGLGALPLEPLPE
ncbi:maleylpyruvate isomerase N-terminal domain-containing protein [Nocardioides marmoraquaticus]